MTKIIILGGGFGGVRCVLDLNKKFKEQAQITLIDKNSYHLFLPSLYEIASAYGTNPPSALIGGGGDPFAVKLRKTICIPYREIFEGKNINFVQAEISAVDLKTKIIKTKGGEVLFYDCLVIALGSQTADFGIPGVREYAYQFKSIDDAVAVNVKIGRLVKKIASGEKMDSLKILVGGAGFSGIDLKTQKSVPALAYTASDQGRVVAENIFRLTYNKSLKRYSPYYGVWIAPVGGKFALAHLWGGLMAKGFMGWVVRELVDLRYLVSILSFKKAVSLFWQEIIMFTKND